MRIDEVQRVNAERARRWHGEAGSVQGWSALEWAGAMCGEAGEAANIAKKMRRMEQELSGNQFSSTPLMTYDALRSALARECADTFLYLLLLCERCDIDLASAVRIAFNVKSEQLGFPERL